VPAIYSRGKGGIPTGVEHAKLRACLEVQPAHSNGGRRDVSDSGAVDVTRRATTRWPESWQRWQRTAVSRGGRQLAAVLELGGDETGRRD
jgi:hypothetical protein